jgi:hypothetical protein
MIKNPSTTVARITDGSPVTNMVDASLLGGGTNSAASLTNGLIPLVQFSKVPLDAALKNLIAQSHINVVLDPKVSNPAPHGMFSLFSDSAPTLSIRWENIAARQAIVALCENYDLVIVKDSATGVIRIKPKD